jgi:hypothetical protein
MKYIAAAADVPSMAKYMLLDQPPLWIIIDPVSALRQHN